MNTRHAARTASIAAFTFVLALSPYTRATAASNVQINDPVTDTLQLWTSIEMVLESAGRQLAIALEHQQPLAARDPHQAHAPINYAAPSLAAAAALSTEPITPAVTATRSVYVVRAGDTLLGIAGHFDVSLSTLLSANGLTTSSLLRIGQTLIIPPSLSSNGEAVTTTPEAPTTHTNVLSSEGAAPSDKFVTQDQFNAALTALGTSVRQLIAESASNPVVSGAGAPLSVEAFAPSQQIGQLANTTITNPTISGGSLSNVSVSGITGLTTSSISDLILGTPADAQQSTVNIAAWGDSLTAGNEDGTGVTYPGVLSSVTGHYVFNGGVGGQTAAQIAARMILDTSKYSWPAIIWAGRNDVGTTSRAAVEASIASMVAVLTTPNYIILPIFNNGSEPAGSADYIWIQQVNSYLAATYGSHYLDAREYLVQDGLSAAGITPSAQDLSDIANDIPPTDLRDSSATVHLNHIGYTVLADYIAANANLLYSTTTPHFVTTATLQSLFSSPSSFGFVNSLSNYSISGNQVMWSSPTTFSTLLGNGAGALFNASNTSETAIGYGAVGSTTSATIGDTGVGYSALSSDYGTGGNTALGAYAMQFSTTSTTDVAVGFTALRYNQTGTQNNAIGNYAMNGIGLGLGNTGSNNNAFGAIALEHNTSGADNTAMGTNALQYNTTGTSNQAIAYGAMQQNTTGSNNVAIGQNASRWNLSATTTVAIGDSAGEGFLNNFSAQGYTIIGAEAGTAISTGSNYNVMIGYQQGGKVTTGANNILIGGITTAANANITTGSNNIGIGFNTGVASGTLSNQLDIQNIIYGTNNSGAGSTVSNGNIGIGTTTPFSRLEVWGPDTSGNTSSFVISNSASTTEFNVLDNGNAILAGTLTQNSDQRLKTNIQSLDASSSLSLINQLNPVTFNWIDPSQASTTQLGFIAQQVQSIFPGLIATTSPTALTPGGTLSLNYIDLISPVVSAIQALSADITSIENTIAGFAQSITSERGNFTNELCVGSTCVTPAQFQAMVAAASASQGGGSSSSPSDNSIASSTSRTPPVISINGDNPAIVQVGATYSDLGATITGPQADLNLGIVTLLNGALTSNIVIDTSAAATDTIDYVVTDQNGLTSTSTRTIIIEPSPSIVPSDNASTTADATTTGQ